MSRNTLARPSRAACVALCVLTFAGCARNPVTGRTQLALISEGQEIEMGRQAAQQAEQSLGLVDDAALQAYVQRLGAALAARSERPNLPWTFRVIDDPTPNAFALPGGFIYVTRGLMNLMDSESELATVLGHEIGHVTARHSVTAISRAQLAQLGLGVGMILAPELQQFGQVASSGLGLLFLKHGRDAERQADDLGFKYALNQGYDVREMADVFASLQRAGEKEDQGRVPSWLATHPYPEERIQRVQERLATLGPARDSATLGRAEYLGRINGLMYGENPRSGIFRGTAFLHPDLNFRIDFPQGWRTQNMPQAVVAVSPQQDAIVQLTLAGQASPTAAAQQFFSQQGVQQGQTTRETINGIPAIASYFQAQTQQGVVGGLVAFLSYGGRTFQLLGYTPAQQFGRYDALFRRTVGSFGPLNDPQVQAIQPNRLDVVKINQAMTLSEFNQRYPSVIPIEELALINQVENASARLAAGTLVKRVIAGQRAGSTPNQ